MSTCLTSPRWAVTSAMGVAELCVASPFLHKLKHCPLRCVSYPAYAALLRSSLHDYLCTHVLGSHLGSRGALQRGPIRADRDPEIFEGVASAYVDLKKWKRI